MSQRVKKHISFTFVDHMSMGALGDSFYEYLLKSWIQSNGEDIQALQMFQELAEVRFPCGFSLYKLSVCSY